MSEQRYKAHFFICNGKACSEKGSPDECKKFFKDKINEHGLKSEMRACSSSCLDLCDHGPNIVVYPEGTWYSGVGRDEWQKIFNCYLKRQA